MIIMLGIDWGNSDEYIHTSTWAWEPRCVVTVRQVAHFIGGLVSVVESSHPKFILDTTAYLQARGVTKVLQQSYPRP